MLVILQSRLDLEILVSLLSSFRNLSILVSLSSSFKNLSILVRCLVSNAFYLAYQSYTHDVHPQQSS